MTRQTTQGTETGLSWPDLRDHVHGQLYCSVASVEDGLPRLRPIGSVYLTHEPGLAWFAEMFVRPLPEDTPLELMVVNASRSFWLGALLKGKFSRTPALRLQAVTGVRRPPTDAERELFRRRVAPLLLTPGGKKLWSKLPAVRELKILSAEPVHLGPMSRDLNAGWRLPEAQILRV